MARDLTGKNVKADAERAEIATQRSNSAWRAEEIRKTAKSILGIKAEIKKLNEEKAEILQKVVKGDLGMKIADFNAALRWYALEKPEDRDAYLDTMRECFLALGVGEQSDFFAVMDGSEHGAGGEDEPDETEEAAPTSETVLDFADRPKAYQKGYSTGEAGKSLTENPYKDGSKMAKLFMDGWHDAQAEMVKRYAKDADATHEGTPSLQ